MLKVLGAQLDKTGACAAGAPFTLAEIVLGPARVMAVDIEVHEDAFQYRQFDSARERR